MRKKIAILFGLLVFLPAMAFASSYAISIQDSSRDNACRVIQIGWLGTPTVPSTATVTLPSGKTTTLGAAMTGYYIIGVETSPYAGGAAPTAYGATMIDAFSFDQFGGKITAMSTTAAAQTNLQTNFPIAPLNLPFNIAFTGNTNASGGGYFLIYLLYAGQTQAVAP